MRNFNESDYALNKYSEGIVYKFADGKTQTIWLEDYLSANPGKSAEDFAKIKALSDELYHEQVIVEHRTGRLDVTINGLEETEQLATVSIDTELIHKADTGKALKAAKLLLNSGKLTEIQRRRFILHFFKGLSIRQIAEIDQVDFRAVWESLHWATKKLKKLYRE